MCKAWPRRTKSAERAEASVASAASRRRFPARVPALKGHRAKRGSPTRKALSSATKAQCKGQGQCRPHSRRMVEGRRRARQDQMLSRAPYKRTQCDEQDQLLPTTSDTVAYPSHGARSNKETKGAKGGTGGRPKSKRPKGHPAPQAAAHRLEQGSRPPHEHAALPQQLQGSRQGISSGAPHRSGSRHGISSGAPHRSDRAELHPARHPGAARYRSPSARTRPQTRCSGTKSASADGPRGCEGSGRSRLPAGSGTPAPPRARSRGNPASGAGDPRGPAARRSPLRPKQGS